MKWTTEQATEWISDWAAHARKALREARERQQSLLATWSTAIAIEPNDLMQVFTQDNDGSPRYYWSSPSDEHTLVGRGSAYTCIGYGEHRFQQVDREMQWVESAIFATHASAIRWMGGFSFDCGPRRAPWTEWADMVFTIPVFLFEQKGSVTQFTISQWLRPDAEWDSILRGMTEQILSLCTTLTEDVHLRQIKPGMNGGPQPEAVGQEAWKAAVARTSAEIRSGMYEKAVLARQQTYTSPNPFSIHASLQRLQAEYGESFIYGVYQKGQCFVGASPERLVRANHEEVSIDCLAGTMGRGRTPTEDIAIGEQLLTSPKNREEHAVVLRWLQSMVEDMVRNFTAPSVPQLKKLKNVQHLHSPIRARLLPEYSLLDVASRLHPTPAVAGNPRERALDVIRQRENMDRGWYAGAVGWKGAQNDGEFSVALRCALVSGCQAHLFAGGGIMGDSDPEQEWIETKLKMRPMEMALGCLLEEES